MIDPAFAEQLSTAAQRGLAELRAIRETVHESIARDGLADAARKLLERTRYADELARIYTEPEERERRWNSVEELVNAISEYQLGSETNLAGFLAETALSGREFNEKDKGRSRNEVGMYTFHSAKGLEFPVVYMVGMEEGLLPHHRTVRDDEHEVDEERRLCYVGITRAQEQLTLSMALTRRKWGKPRPTQPSRFLYEITGKTENPRKRK
jgi:DNA helicase-2/ATP-dependent DNA helicase PcrA